MSLRAETLAGLIGRLKTAMQQLDPPQQADAYGHVFRVLLALEAAANGDDASLEQP